MYIHKCIKAAALSTAQADLNGLHCSFVALTLTSRYISPEKFVLMHSMQVDDTPRSVSAALRNRLSNDDFDHLTKDELHKIRAFLEAYPDYE